MNPYGVEESRWIAAKDEIRQVLMMYARNQRLTNYQELAGQIRTIKFEAWEQKLWCVLDEISEEEHQANRGMLSCLVVHKPGPSSDMEPGPGFYKLGTRLGKDASDKTKFWIEECKKVWAYWATH